MRIPTRDGLFGRAYSKEQYMSQDVTLDDLEFVPDGYMTIAQVAAYLGFHVSTVLGHIDRNVCTLGKSPSGKSIVYYVSPEQCEQIRTDVLASEEDNELGEDSPQL